MRKHHRVKSAAFKKAPKGTGGSLGRLLEVTHKGRGVLLRPLRLFPRALLVLGEEEREPGPGSHWRRTWGVTGKPLQGWGTAEPWQNCPPPPDTAKKEGLATLDLRSFIYNWWRHGHGHVQLTA